VEYKERYKDINVQKVVGVVDPQGQLCQLELYGEKLDGEPTWILCHIAPNTEYKFAVASDD